MNTLETAAGARCSRRTAIKGAGAGAAGLGLALAGTARFEPVAAQAESVQDILNITATTEAFGVTVLGEALASNEQGNYDQPFPEPVVAILTAARAQEQFHLEFFQGIGGELLTDTFTVPPELLTDYAAFFSALVLQETSEVAAQIAAFQTFTAAGRSDLVKVSFQYAAEEAEHRVLANYALGSRPANDIAFAPALFGSVTEFLASLEERGIIGGAGAAITYPGPGEIDATGVTERVPGGPEVACAPVELPSTGTGTGSLGPVAGSNQDLPRLLGLLGLGGAAVAAGLSYRTAARASARADAQGPHA